MSTQQPAPANSVAAQTPEAIGAALGRTLTSIDIPPCPAILERIQAEMRKEEPDFRALDRIVSSDVGLAAGLVALSNSPFFSPRNRVRSVHAALCLLGLRTTSSAIASLILARTFSPPPSMMRFWDGSARIARLSGWLAQEERTGVRIPADEAYTFGLFRDCGIPILMKRFQTYQDVLRRANEATEGCFTKAEDEALKINHAVVGGLLAQAWWLPNELCVAIRHHHDFELLGADAPGTVPPASRKMIATAQLAEHLVQQRTAVPIPGAARNMIANTQLAEHLFQRHTALSHTHEWEKAGAACMEVLGIDEQQVERLCEQSAPVIDGEEF